MEPNAYPAAAGTDATGTGDCSGNETWKAEFAYARQSGKLPPCQANCPSGTDIRGWVNIIAQREKNGLDKDEAYARAWRRLVDFNPLPAVVGRVCPHTCEVQCNRGEKEGAVSIHALERYIGDWALQARLPLSVSDYAYGRESIGVIGSGPAGLSFAYQMARRGYAVTIYEKNAIAGGMLRYGIPAYRLPRDVLQAEIQRILDLGVDLKLATRVGRDITAAELKSRHRAVFVAIGADKPHRLGVAGEDSPAVLAGTQFMYRVNQGHAIDTGTAVVVVGGGNTAVDAARAARRRGAEVTLLYRRTRQEMPAIAEEVDDALDEGVRIDFLAAPLAIQRDGETVRAVVVQRMRLGEADASGRAKPVAVPGDTYEIPASTVIPAVSQESEWEGLSEFMTDGKLPAPDAHGRVADDLWAGGDVLGLGTVTRAIGHGRRAAEAMHAMLRGNLDAAPELAPELAAAANMNLDHYPPRERTDESQRPVAERFAEPDREVKLGIGDDQFNAEIARCLSCGNCFGCQLCWMYCTGNGYTPRDRTAPGEYFILDRTKCEGCGKCVELCPCGYLSAEPTLTTN